MQEMVTMHANTPMDDDAMDLSELFLGPKFAQGGNSRLYHGTYKDQSVAVKIIQQPHHHEGDDDDDDHKEKQERLAFASDKQFNQEVRLLSLLQHPNVIKLIASCKQPSFHCIVTEYMSQGSLRTYLNKLYHDETRLSFQKLVSIALEIARGMEYIHSKGVMHCDLKPENVLIDDRSHMKIADFGVSCEEGSCSGSDQQGTYRWMAPEMIKRKSCTRKVDVYSFGLMMFELVTGSIPFKGMNPAQVAYGVAHKNLRPVFPEECPVSVRDLIQRCWSSEPKKRPEFREIVKALEQFESALASEGTIQFVQTQRFGCRDHKKGFLHRIFHHGSKVHVIT